MVKSHDRVDTQLGVPSGHQSDTLTQQPPTHGNQSYAPVQQSYSQVQYSQSPGQSHKPVQYSHGPEHQFQPQVPAPHLPYQYNYQRPSIYTKQPTASSYPLSTDPGMGMYGYKPRYIKKKDYKKYGHEIYGNDRKVNQFNSNSLPNQLDRRSDSYQMPGSYQMPPDGQYPTQPQSRPDPFPDIPFIDHGSNQSLNQTQSEAERQPNRGYTEYYDWTEHIGANEGPDYRNNTRYGYGSHPILYNSHYPDDSMAQQYGASNYQAGDYPNAQPRHDPPRHDSSDLGFYDLSYTSLPSTELLNSAPTLAPPGHHRNSSHRKSGQRSHSYGHLEDDVAPQNQRTYLNDCPGANKGWSTLPRNFAHNQDDRSVFQEKQDCQSDGGESQKAFYVLAKPKNQTQPIDTGSNAYFLSRV